MLLATDSGNKRLTNSVQGSFCNKPSTAAEMSSAVSASKLPRLSRPSICCMSWNVLQKFSLKTQSFVQVQDVTGRAAGVSSTVQLETDVND